GAASAALQLRRLLRIIGVLLGHHLRIGLCEGIRHAARLIAPCVRASSRQDLSPIAEWKAPRERAATRRSGLPAATDTLQIGEALGAGLCPLGAGGAAH